MAIDTSAVTAVITSFKAETRENSISPFRLGSLLQSIVDLFRNCAAAGASTSSQTAIKTISFQWVKTQSSLTLQLTLTDTAGETTQLNIPVPVVSSAQAGIMTSAQLASIGNSGSGSGSGTGTGTGTDPEPGGETTAMTMYLGFLDYTITEAAAALAALPSSANVVARTVSSAAGTYQVTNPVAGHYMWIAVPAALTQPTSFTSAGLAFPFLAGVRSGDYFLYRSSDRLKANTIPVTLA